MLLPVVFLLHLNLCDLALLLVQHFGVLGKDVLLFLVFNKLRLKRFLQVLSLILKIKDAPITSHIDHLCLNHINLFCQECDPLPLFGNLSLVICPLLVLLFDDIGLVLSHLVQLCLALNKLGFERIYESFAGGFQTLDLHFIRLKVLVCPGRSRINWTVLVHGSIVFIRGIIFLGNRCCTDDILGILVLKSALI